MRKNRSLFTAPKQRRASHYVYPLLAFLILAVLLVMNVINNNRVALRTQNVTIASLPSDLEKFRILHISDLHGKDFGDEQSAIASVLSGNKYNAVCITGDLCAKDGSYDAFLSLVRLFVPNTPVYFITGDEDPEALLSHAHGAETPKADYIAAAEALGAVYLDAPQKITVGSSVIWFVPESVYGLDIVSARASYTARRTELIERENTAHPDIAAQLRLIDYRLQVLDSIEQSFQEMKRGDIQIALTHHPLTANTIKTLQQWSDASQADFLRGVSLVLAGHYNGGQYRLPFVGAVKAPASAGLSSRWFPGDASLQGLSIVQGITQYISPGLGVSSVYSLPFRLFNTPSVTILTLTGTLTF